MARAPVVASALAAATNAADVRADLQAVHAIAQQIAAAPVAPAANEPATVKLGDLADTLGFPLRADFIEQVLGIKPAGRDRAAILYRPRQVPDIVSALQQHLARVQAGLSKAA